MAGLAAPISIGGGVAYGTRNAPSKPGEWVAPYGAHCAEHGSIGAREHVSDARDLARVHLATEHTAAWLAEHGIDTVTLGLLAGKRVRITEPGDPYFGGRVLRWGTLRGTCADGVVIDGYHDCSGFGDSRGSGPLDGHVVRWQYLLDIRAYYPGA